MKDLKIRVLSACVFSAIMIFFLFIGNIYYDFFLLSVVLLATYELYKAFNELNVSINIPILFLSFTLIIINKYCFQININLIISISFILMMIICILKDEESINNVAYSVLTLVYLSILLAFPNDIDKRLYRYIFYILPLSCDTFAYFVGSMFGKHKLMPKISPKKTIEGLLGGITGCSLISGFIFYYFNLGNIALGLLMGVFVAIVSVFGDLISSKIKRVCGIKDFGKIMPGHGGILDRFDSVIACAPVIYLFLILI